ncbi:MAG: hypothetical protein ABIL67_04850 [candidate division WOR-3 bacterium]
MIILLAYTDFSENLVREIFGREWGYDSTFIYEKLRYNGYADTVRVYTYEDFFGLRLLKSVKEDELKKSDTSFAKGVGLIPDISVPVYIPSRWRFLGEGISKVSLTGNQTISLGGRQDSYIFGGKYDTVSSDIPQLQMKQTLNVNITGQITDRLKVTVTHNSEATDFSRNQVKLSYTGTDDDIVQSLEAGDIDASGFPTTSYTSIGAGAGLFGLKGKFGFGPSNVVFLATRERGVSQTKVFTLQSQIITDTIYARDYVRDRFFYIPISLFVPDPENYAITDIRLYYTTSPPPNDVYTYAKAYFRGDTTWPDTSVCVKFGRWKELTPGKDFITSVGGRVIEVINPPGGEWWLGAVITLVKGSDTVRIGNIPQNPDSLNPIKMLLLKRNRTTLSDTSIPCAVEINSYEVKYAYRLPGDIDTTVSSVKVDIFRDLPSTSTDPNSQDGIPFTKILGIDNNQDGFADDYVQVNGVPFRILDKYNGYIFIPKFWPFADSSLKDRDSLIYMVSLQDIPTSHRDIYYIVVSFEKPQKEITLGFGLVEGSVEIFANGQKLTENVDYTVDYFSGKIRILKTDLPPNTELKVNYRSYDIFGGGNKGIIALSSTFDLSENAKFHLNYISKSLASSYLRPAVGFEPTSYKVLSFDGKINHTMDYLNSFLNRYTFLSLEQKSNLSVEGEIARSFPNPNTRGEAYIDDFDRGASSLEEFADEYIRWYPGSWPRIDSLLADTNYYAIKTSWVSTANLFTKGQIYPNLDPTEINDREKVMIIVARPKTDGLPHWTTLMRLINESGYNYLEKEYLELYAKGRGRVIVDLGTDIPEDMLIRDCRGKIRGLDTLNTEDKDGDFLLSGDKEDTGFDGVKGDDRAGCGNGDWGNDDYAYISDLRNSDFSPMNGFEGNGRLDTEDMDKDGTLNGYERYFTYVFDLDNMTPISEYNGWKQFRIPLKKPDYKVGTPTLERIRYIRITWVGFDKTDTLYIVNLGIGGSDWVNEGVKVDTADTVQKFVLGFVSRKTTPGYTSPPGVEDKLQRDITTGKLEDEGSLVMEFQDFAPGEYALARKSLTQSLNFINYKSVSFWIKGVGGYTPKVIIRFGTDSLNFYEYKYKVKGGDWQEVKINLEDLVRFKDSTSSVAYRSNGTLGVKGNPNIFDVRFFWVGIENDGSTRNSGIVWINELRLTDPVRTSANAGKININFKLSDLFSLSTNGQIEQVDFAQSATQRNTYDKRSYNITATLNSHRFLPSSWGLTAPITVSYSTSGQLPKYKPGLDVPIKTNYEKNLYITTSESKSLGWSFKKTGSKSLLGRVLLDAWNLSNSFSSSSTNGPEVRDTSFKENYRVSYSYNPRVEFKIFNRIIYPLPSYSFSYTYNRDYSKRFILGSPTTTVVKSGNFSGDINYNLVPGLLTLGYGISRTGDYRYDTLFKSRRDSILGYESSYGERYSGSLNIPQIFILQPGFSYSHTYNENHSLEIRPSPHLDVRNLDENLNVQASFSIFHGQLLSKIGSLRDESKDTSLQTAGPLHAILYGLDKISQFWNNMRITYSFSRNSRFNLVQRRADWRYRLGITNDPNAGISLDSFANTWTERNAVDVNTGINFWDLSLQPRYSFSRTFSYTKVRQSITNNTRFPDITVSLAKIPFISSIKFITSSNANLSFSKDNTLTYYPPTPPDSSYDKRTSTTLSVSPNFILSSGSSLNITYTRTISQNEQLLTFKSGTRDIQTNIDFTASHTLNGFGGFRLPWSKGNFLSLKNMLVLSLTYSINSSRSDAINYKYDPIGGFEYPQVNNLSDRRGYSFSLSATYSFSNAVDATFVYSRSYSYDRKTTTGSKSNELRVDVKINF